MSIALAEQLKKDLTDRYVVVAEGVPELRRFQGLTGTVKTVNMNGRALVQFDGAVDISWYDIDPAYLHVVDAPLKKEKPEAHAAPAKAAPAASAAKPAGQSPLDAIRAKAAGGAAAPAPAAAGEKKASPLDQIRAGAAKPAAAPAAGGSPLDKIRAAQAAKTAEAPVASAPEAAAAVEAPAPAEAAPAPAAPPPSASPQPKSTADILAAIRKKS